MKYMRSLYVYKSCTVIFPFQKWSNQNQIDDGDDDDDDDDDYTRSAQWWRMVGKPRIRDNIKLPTSKLLEWDNWQRYDTCSGHHEMRWRFGKKRETMRHAWYHAVQVNWLLPPTYLHKCLWSNMIHGLVFLFFVVFSRKSNKKHCLWIWHGKTHGPEAKPEQKELKDLRSHL